jgi:lysophospholipase L1-like esterase
MHYAFGFRPHSAVLRFSGILLTTLTLWMTSMTSTSPAMQALSTPIRIMPLGDSLTEGYPQMQGGYRTPLWDLLNSQGLTTEFVGSMTDGFEWIQPHHEGHSGWKIGDLDQQVGIWISTYQPDIVLLMIGTNDILNHEFEGMTERYGTLIDHIFSVKPDVWLVVSRVPPIGESTFNSQVQAFNRLLPEIIQMRAAAGQQISLVDMYAPFTSSDLLDGVHFNDFAYPRVAEVWQHEIDALVRSSLHPLAPVASESIHTPFYAFTWTQTGSVDATYKIKVKDEAGVFKHVEKYISQAVCSSGICRTILNFETPPPNRTALRWKIAIEGQSSPWRSFSTDMPGAPQLVKPFNGEFLETTAPKFVWSQVPDAEEMQLIIDQINLPDENGGMNGKARVVEVTLNTASTPSLAEVCDPGTKRCSLRLETLGTLLPGTGDYRWSIKTRSAFGKGRSVKWLFNVTDGIITRDQLLPLPPS